MNKPLISILVPMYNIEKYVGKTIQSLVDQTYQNIEIVLVDDGSTDNTYNIAKQYAQSCNKIVLLKKENQKNISLTRNFLLEHISGEYFAFVDSDDLVAKTYIEDLYSALEKNDADLSCCNFTMGKIEPKFYARKNFKFKVFSQEKNIVNTMFGREVRFMVWNKLFKKSILQNIQFDKDLKYGEDFAFVYDYVKKCEKIVYINKRLYFYRIRSGSLTHQKFSEKKYSFITYLQNKIKEEKLIAFRKLLKAWLCFACVGFIFLANSDKKQFKEEIKVMKELANKYKKYLRKIKDFAWYYKLVGKFGLVFWC